MIKFILGVFASSNYWFIVLRSTAPILLVTLGAVITEQAGIKNMALEGSMLWAALAGVIVSAATGNAWIGLLAGIAASVCIALILGLFALKLDANAVLCGVALNLFSTGGTVFVLFSLTGDKGVSSSLASKTLPFIKIPFIDKLPWLGKVISGQNIAIWFSLLAVVAIHLILNKATIGRRIRATGENVEAAKAAGIDPDRIKFFSLIISGILAGIAGCFLSMGYTSNFTSGISAGRGYVANAAQVVAGGTAIGGDFRFPHFRGNRRHGHLSAEFRTAPRAYPSLALLRYHTWLHRRDLDSRQAGGYPQEAAFRRQASKRRA